MKQRVKMETMTEMWKDLYKKLGQINQECPSENAVVSKTMRSSAYEKRADVIVEMLGTGDSILEIGCGYGGLAQEILKKISVTTSSTISPNSYTVVDNKLMLKQAKKFLGDRVEYVVADEIETLRDRKFELFISDYCLNEVPSEFREYVFENIIKNCQKISVLDTDWYDIEKCLRKYFILEKTNFHTERFAFAGERKQPKDTRKISILIPTWNNVEYLKIVIPAIRKHTINPYEMLVYANEMSSETKKYALKEGFDIFEYSLKNEGIPVAVNVLAKQATGEIIFYLNDDMYVTPGWDEPLIRKINDNIFYQYLTPCIFEPRWKNPTMNSPFDYGRTSETWQEQKFLSEWKNLRLIKEDIISGSVPTFVKKELWDKVGGYGEEYWPGFGTDPDFVAKIYFMAKKEGKPYEFRGVADSGAYHFQCVSTERIKNDKLYRQEAHKRIKEKWGVTAQQLNEFIGSGRKLN